MLWRAIIILLVLVIFVLGYSAPARTPAQVTVATSTEEVAAPVITISATSALAFHETGTLVFYPNNVGPVPYLFYVNDRGATVARALLFDALPPTDFSAWTGARVDVTGIDVREHILVHQIAYIASP
jgi:hypothetical protein